MSITVREYGENDINGMISVWNEVVRDGVAFPQTERTRFLKAEKKFFLQSKTCCAVAVDENGEILGMYILHPNNIGRCGHICNASYAVSSSARGKGVGRKLVSDCLERAKKYGFKILQFNAVVKTNTSARNLYESLGFVKLGVIPKGFLMKDGHYEDICPYYKEL